MSDRAFVLVILLAVVVGTLFTQHQAATRLAESGRLQCERVNDGVRQPLYDFLVSAGGVRREQARFETNVEARRSDLRSVREFRGYQRQMVAAAVPAEESGSPRVDCDAAYPTPGWFG